MRLSQEVYDAIRAVCTDNDQDEEFIKMVEKALENKLDSNFVNDDLRSLIEKVRL